jgi:hypothetical protein
LRITLDGFAYEVGVIGGRGVLMVLSVDLYPHDQAVLEA